MERIQVITEGNPTIGTDATVKVETPSGQVYIGYDPTSGMATVVVRGDKGSTNVKFNDKAVV